MNNVVGSQKKIGFFRRRGFEVFIAVLIFTPLVLEKSTSPGLFEFRYNPYALMSGLCLVVIATFVWLLRHAKLESEEATWLLAYMGGLGVYAAGEMFQRLATSVDASVFWAQVSGAGAAGMAAAIYLFALFYTRPESRHNVRVSMLLLGALAMIFYSVNSQGIFYFTQLEHVKLYPWGYNNDASAGFIVYTLWFVGLVIGALRMLYKFRKQTYNPDLKKQTSLFLIGMSIPLFGGVVTDILLPGLGIESVPPLGTFFSVGTVGILIYGMLRYKVLRLSPSLIAQNILSTMHESVIVTDTKLVIEFMNTEAMKLVSAKKSLSAQSLIGVFDDLKTEEFYEHLNSLKPGQSYALEDLTITQPDDSKLYLRAQVSRVSENDLTEGYLLAVTDVTELKESERKLEQEKKSVEHKVEIRTRELREERARLEASINSLNTGYFMTDPANKLIMINAAALKILFDVETNHASETKTKLEDIAHILNKNFKLMSHIEKCLEDRKPQIADSVGLRGKILRIFLAPIVSHLASDSEILGVVVLIEDITEAKILERSRDEFFSIASHELRTPLTAIRGNSDMVKQFYKDIVKDGEFEQMVDDIHNSSVQLIDIVNDFLDASSLEQGKVNFEIQPFDISEVLENVIYETATVAKKKNLSVHFANKTLGDLPRVSADPSRVKQVIYNLIGNALKFTEKGAVTIDVSHDKSKLKILVTDSGRGISEENQKLLFHKFQQAGDSLYTRDTSRGTGLGLYISQLFAKGMGGEVTLESSELGKGSTFSLTIPLAKSTQPAKNMAAAKS